MAVLALAEQEVKADGMCHPSWLQELDVETRNSAAAVVTALPPACQSEQLAAAVAAALGMPAAGLPSAVHCPVQLAGPLHGINVTAPQNS